MNRRRYRVRELNYLGLKLLLENNDLKKCSLSDTDIYYLQKCCEDVPHLLMRRHIKNWQHKTVSSEKYPEALRKFACSLQFYSSKAYEYVRKTFALALLHQSIIRNWSSNINCHPRKFVFKTINIQVATKPDSKIY